MKYNEEDLKYPDCLKSVNWIKKENNIQNCEFYCKKPRKLKGDTINTYISFCMAKHMPCSDYDGCYFKQLERLKLKAKDSSKSCTTCDNFSIESVYGVCCVHGALSEIVENCKDFCSND